jgi:hypothetical protein
MNPIINRFKWVLAIGLPLAAALLVVLLLFMRPGGESEKDRIKDDVTKLRIRNAALTVQARDMIQSALAALKFEKPTRQEQFAMREAVDLYRDELALSAKRLGALEEEAHRKLSERELPEVLQEIDETRAALTKMQEAAESARTEVLEALDKHRTALERAIDKAFGEAEKALKDLPPEQPKEPKP